MDKAVIEKVNKYAELIKPKYPVKMIVLYGSYAKGMENENSDIDVAVIIDEVNDNYLDISSRSFKYVLEIDERIEPNLIYIKNNRNGFLESILKYGKIIYKSA